MKRGKDNPNYRHGKYIENRCLTCKKKIDPRSTFCYTCRPGHGHNHSEKTKSLIGRKSREKFTDSYIERIYHSKHRGKKKYVDGYVLVKDYEHPNKNSHNDVLEHILVMSTHLGRPIHKGEIIHHIDNSRCNNELENLYLCSDRRSHSAVHSSINKLIGPLLEAGVIIFDKLAGEYRFTEEVV